MYAMNPYYVVDGGQEQSTSSAMNTSALTPLPLLPTEIDLNDANIRNTLDDILSRQMLLLCRLNHMEQQLLNLQAPSTEDKCTVQAKQLTVDSIEPKEAVAIHFTLDSIPYSTFALINVLCKRMPVLTSLHVHSSVKGKQSVTRIDELKINLKKQIGFQFNNTYLYRSKFSLIVEFIVSNEIEKPTAMFHATKQILNGELSISKQLVYMFGDDDQDLQTFESIWSSLIEANELSSTNSIIESLRPLVFNLSDQHFLGDRSSPSLIDVVLWSFAVMQFQRAEGKLASTIKCGSLLNEKWKQAVQAFTSC
ncbi:hypothetical protein BLOT_010618 [Blomia tropicalis]|nr:hypothetical protein BLOT_010618 [Blomia tropicalis]